MVWGVMGDDASGCQGVEDRFEWECTLICYNFLHFKLNQPGTLVVLMLLITLLFRVIEDSKLV